MPRAAVLSINARIERTEAAAWEDPALVQVWGPRYNVYAVAAQDLAVFTLGRFPDDPKSQDRATDLASRLETLLDGESMPADQAGRALGGHPNRLRYATTTGSIVLRWDGARQPTVRIVPPPEVDPADARRELARRYLHVFGPATAESFGVWAGIRTSGAVAAFDQLNSSIVSVATPIGSAWMLDSDVEALRATPQPEAAVRLLPSGDSYFLLQGDQRRLLVPNSDRTPAVVDLPGLAGRGPRRWRHRRNVATRQEQGDDPGVERSRSHDARPDLRRSRRAADPREPRADDRPVGRVARAGRAAATTGGPTRPRWTAPCHNTSGRGQGESAVRTRLESNPGSERGGSRRPNK